MIITVPKLEALQEQGFLKRRSKQKEIEAVWKEINNRCPSVDETTTAQHDKQNEEMLLRFPPNNSSLGTDDICVVFAPNGEKIARYGL